MGWHDSGWTTGWIGWLGMGLMMVLFWGLLVMAVLWLVRTTGSNHTGISAPAAGSRARQVLDDRLARGELTEEEYVRRRDLLQGGR